MNGDDGEGTSNSANASLEDLAFSELCQFFTRVTEVSTKSQKKEKVHKFLNHCRQNYILVSKRPAKQKAYLIRTGDLFLPSHHLIFSLLLANSLIFNCKNLNAFFKNLSWISIIKQILR